MNSLPLITVVLLLTACAALAWLMVRAFKTSLPWGFAVMLLSPFSAIFFGIRYWEKQKRPFLLYITTFTAAFAAGIYLYTVTGSIALPDLASLFQQQVQEHSLARYSNGHLMHAGFSADESPAGEDMFRQDPGFYKGQESAREPGATGTVIPARDIAGSDDGQAEKDNPPVRYRLAYIPVEIAHIKRYIGATAKITRKNAQEKEYLITGASPRHIELAQRSRHGEFSFHFKNSDIENIRVLVNEPY